MESTLISDATNFQGHAVIPEGHSDCSVTLDGSFSLISWIIVALLKDHTMPSCWGSFYRSRNTEGKGKLRCSLAGLSPFPTHEKRNWGVSLTLMTKRPRRRSWKLCRDSTHYSPWTDSAQWRRDESHKKVDKHSGLGRELTEHPSCSFTHECKI